MEQAAEKGRLKRVHCNDKGTIWVSTDNKVQSFLTLGAGGHLHL